MKCKSFHIKMKVPMVRPSL
jgi:hypothetical protein